MKSEQADVTLLWDMLDAARKVVIFAAGKSFGDYEQDDLLRSGVERQVEIIGEAARRISKSFQQEHPEIAWRGIIAQRHVLAHEYGEIRNDLMWRVATVHVPALIEILQPLIPPPPGESVDETGL